MTENLAGRGEGLAGLRELDSISDSLHVLAVRLMSTNAIRAREIGVLASRLDGAQVVLTAALEAAAPPSTAPLNSAAARAKALAEFTLYFVSNYPGPHTIINDPYWHAPKIFKAAEVAIRDAVPAATQEQPAGSGADIGKVGASIEFRFGGSPRKVGEDGQPEKYERTHSRVWVNAWNAALEEVCGLVAVNGSELDFGPFSIGHNPKRVQQEHTMIVELIRALKHPVPALRPSSVPVGEQKQEEKGV